MKIAIAADHAGFDLKAALAVHLQRGGHEVLDLGTRGREPIDYPPICIAAATAAVSGEADFSIVLGGSGQGEQMAANKVAGARAALCNDPHFAMLARRDNNANVLAIGARIVAPELAFQILDVWIATQFEGGRHARRIALIDDYENANAR
jgi:ribose 5-phosphate isomerase B